MTVQITLQVPHGLQARFARLKRGYANLPLWKRNLARLFIVAVIFSLLLEIALPYLNQHWAANAYALDEADKAVISKTNDSMAASLQHDAKSQTYNFNSNYSPTTANANNVHAGGPEIKAVLNDDLSKGVTITDPLSNHDFTITPQLKSLAAKQNKNQIQYPVYLGAGSIIYTADATGVKEDILLRHSLGDKLTFDYKLGLDDEYAAKILPNGSLGIYASSLPLGTVSTSTDKDAALLAKARQNAKKDSLIFELPAPSIHESGGHLSGAKAVYSLKGNKLTVAVTKLKQASYPLSIDPTVQISTTSEFYRNTSIESNADFDSANNQITRGDLTGGTTANWTATTTMNQARFLASSVAYNGYIYTVGGSASTSSTANLAGNSTNMVEYASIAATTPTVSGGTTTNPSVFGTWAAGNNSGLPTGGLSRFQLVAYHGFIYAIGGSTTDTTCATQSSTVYYAAVQVNGVLSNWSTTNAPTTARCSLGATTYNGKIYIAGGKTGSGAATGSTDVSYATVNPDGTLTWTSGVSAALPAARYGNDLQAYNGYLYVVGGNLNGTLTNNVAYIALNTDGSLYGTTWNTTNLFTTARENLGTSFSVIKNGYIYLSGGCSVLNAGQTCTTGLSDTQLAQINADGSLGQWATTTSLTAVRVGGVEVVWRGTIYNVGGCAAMNSGAIYCTTPLATTQYGTITAAGQASVLKTLTSVSNPNQILPVGLFGAAAAVLNGYIYVVGGCITNSCQSNPGGTSSDTSNQTYYAQILTDGTLGSWQYTAANTINGTGQNAGLAETALVAANGSLFAFGGYNYTGPLQKTFSITPSSTTGALPGAWTSTGNATIPTAGRYAMSAMYLNGNVITFGGCSAGANAFGCNTYYQDVVKYPISGATIGAANATGQTALTAGTASFPNAVMGIAFYYNRVYLCGGANSANGQTQKCVFAPVSSTGIVGTWTTSTGSLNTNTSPNHPIRRNAAYAANGYLYVFSGHDGTTGQVTSIGTINIGKINPSTGNIDSNFSISTTAFTAKWDAASAFANGNIYTVGGCTNGNPPTTCSVRSSSTEYFQIYNATNSGTRSVTNGTSLSSSYTGTSAAASDGYIYTAGGCSSYTIASGTCATSVNNTYFMAVNPDGSMNGTWTAGPALPAARGYGCMVALNGTLYYIGGSANGTAASDVYYISASGSSWASSSWTAVNSGSATGKLLAAKDGLSCGTWNNRIYATGGAATNTTYYSPTLASGGDITSAWTATTNAFTTSRKYHSTVAVGGYLYVIGGYDGTNYLSDVQYAKIASGGDVGAWSYTNDLPYKLRQASIFAANGYVYILGGSTNATGTCSSAQYVASVNSDGTLGAWTQGVATSFSARAGQATAYYNGYYYVIGGNDCSSGNIATASVGGEQSQAIRSIFTRYIDFVGDATPQKFVVNGTNSAVNSVDIEKWRLTYASSRVATNAFGNNTVITPLSFGSNPVAISAINGSGTNQGVSRYWLLTFDIDQTNSFVFTDDVQPAIISYSFYYSPAGANRLRNGRIFQDQTKQSLDAHP